MDLNKLLEAITGLHGEIYRLRAELEKNGLVDRTPYRWGQSSKRVGKIEKLLLAVAAELAEDFSSMPRLSFIEQCAARLPLRPDAQRDTRRQMVMRALGTLQRIDAAPLRVDGDVVRLGFGAPQASDLI